MANAVNDTRLPNSQSGAEIRPGGNTGPDLEAGIIRLENNLKSLQSAAAMFAHGGRVLIDQIKTMKMTSANADALPRGEAEERLRDAANWLGEIDDFVHCALLASMSVEGQSKSNGISVVLGHALLEMQKLSEDLTKGQGPDL